MKKIIITCGAVLAFSFAKAQSTNTGTFSKPVAGSSLVEVSFTPNLSGATMFALPSYYGNAATEGLRLRKFSTDTDAIRYTALLSVNKENSDAETAVAFALGIGVEHHMKGASRLSTYWGYEGNMGYSYDATKKTTLGVSAQLFTGCDYYIMPNVYLGCELNYGLSVLTAVPDGGNESTKVGLNPNLSPTLRMGWKF